MNLYLFTYLHMLYVVTKLTYLLKLQGLLLAIQEVLPLAKYRFYAKYIYANWNKKRKGGELKKKFFCLCLEHI